MNVIAVVPSYEEEFVVGDTVRSLRAIEEVDTVLVIDDGSSDRTADAAVDAGARMVVNSPNLGKGSSLNRVLPNLDFDVLLLIDGDIGNSATEARALLKPVLSGEADLAIAAFPSPELKGGFGLAQGLARLGIERLGERKMTSPLSGQRALTREVYSGTSPFEAGFGVEVGMTVDALSSGFRVVEVATEMSHNETGRDIPGFIHRGIQFADITRVLVKRSLTRGR
jgi:glycosyltransferase involved in cell wall biosynthesis